MKPMRIKYLLAFVFVVLFASSNASAAEVQTNFDWFTFTMTIPKTNVCVGDKIAVSVTVSNISTQVHMIPWYHGDPCNYGMGHLEITCGNSIIPCRLSRDLRAELARYYVTGLREHESRIFESDLASGYCVTNPSDYTIRAVGWFDEHDNATNRHDVAITTPPITISISPKSGTIPAQK